MLIGFVIAFGILASDLIDYTLFSWTVFVWYSKLGSFSSVQVIFLQASFWCHSPVAFRVCIMFNTPRVQDDVEDILLPFTCLNEPGVGLDNRAALHSYITNGACEF